MGVRGLSTFVKDNQGSICKTVTLEQRRDGDQTERIPVIVDAWGLIFQLWLSSLPWTSGGEYLRYYRLVHRLIAAWRSVGLEPIFIFDGSAPNSKIETILSRLDEQLRTARIFYTASPASRSEPSFSKSCGKQLLPPLASQTFIHAVHDAQAEAHFVPVGEADGACVSLAEERGAYVFGLDSDYFVLVGSAGLRGVRGYCPTDMMQWVDGDEAVQPGQSGGSGGAGDGWSMPRQFGRPPYNNGPRHNGPNTDWSTAGPRARPYKQRQSQLLPPSDARSPSLILRVVTPAALRARLRIPPQMMPLFGALIGNDHTPAIAADHFFEPGLHSSQKVDKAARAIREVVFAPKPRPAGPINAGAVSSTSGTSTPNGSDAGDHAYLLVKRIMARLAWKPFLTENIQTEVMEAIIEATVEYALPFLAKCCDEYPFCGEMVQAGGCENAAKAWAEDEAEPHTPTPISGTARARRAYAAAQKKGLLNHATHVYMYPHRVLLWAVMEDPAGPSLKAEAGAVALRTAAYGYVEEALGGLIWERATKDVEEDTEAQQDVPESDRVMTEEEENAAATRLLDSDTVDETANGKSTTDADIQPEGLERLSTETEIVPKRHIIEFVRHTNRHAPFRLDLPPITSAPHTPMAIAPLTNRLQAFLAPLHSATPLILALPPCLQPLAAYVRYCIIETAIRASRSRSSSSSPNSGSDARWTGGEVTAILKGGVGSFACWSREKVALSKPASSKAAGQEEPVAWPELSTRNSHLLSQLGSIMTDSLYLAQALLLLPDTELEEGMQGSPMGVKRKVSGTGSADGPSGGDTGGSGDPVDQRKSGAGNGPDAAVPVNTNGNASSHSQGIPPIAGKTRPSLPRSRSEARMPNLTHLTPFVFFSGINLHMLLRGEIPPGWQWSERDEKLLQTLLSAVREGLPDGTVRGWTTQRSLGVGTGAIDGTNGPEVNGYGVTGSGESHSRVTSAASDGTAMSDSSFLIDEGSEGSKAKKGKKKKGANGINGKAGQVPAGNAKGGRFDILASSVA